jgi:hypothetical protein
VTPHSETCNGRDDDCNGVIDDGMSSNQAVLLVINVDVPEVEFGHTDLVDGIMQAIGCDSASLLPEQFAVVEFGEANVASPYVRLDQDFANVATTCATLSDPFFGEADAEEEYAYDGMIVAEALAWPSSVDRWVYVFTDEEPNQSSGGATYEDILGDCLMMPYKVGAFLDFYGEYNAFDNVISACGGFKDRLLPEADFQSQVLSTHLACVP